MANDYPDMTMRSLFLVALLVTSSVAASDELRDLLQNRVDRGKTVGLVAGIIDARGQRIVSCGRIAKDRDVAPGGDTIFEIGSVTKVFTSLLLADMVERGEVRLDTPVAELLPKSVKVLPATDARLRCWTCPCSPRDCRAFQEICAPPIS